MRRPLILYPDKDEEVMTVRLSKFVLTRIMVWILTIFVGITVVFFLQRMMPSDPINNMIGKITSMGTSLSPEEIESMRTALMRQYGLDGTLLEQYGQTLSAAAAASTRSFGSSLRIRRLKRFTRCPEMRESRVRRRACP